MAEQASSSKERFEDVFQDEIIEAFADITSFKKFARSNNGLCLDQSDIETIVEDHRDKEAEQMLKMLFKWRELEGEKATVQKIRHLLQMYFRNDNPSDYIILENGMFIVCKISFLCKRSSVYLGEQICEVSDNQTRAIKFIPKNEKNLKEAKILMKLGNHVNVVKVIHAGIHHGDPHDYIYIAMEHSWTQTVRNMLEKCMGKPFQEFTAWSLVEQLMRAVDFLHSHKIIHRDLKPDNILASDDWTLFKVTDYGLSIEITDGTAITQTNANIGTNGYRSRETYNLNVKITAKADIFSAGITIGEIMANGKHPFGEDSDLWAYNIENNKNLNLSHLCVGNKDQVINLIQPMLEMDPEKRPTADEVLNDVSRHFQTFQLNNQQTTTDESSVTSLKARTELSITEKANAIIIWNMTDKHLYSYKLSTKEWSQMQEFPDGLWFSTVTSGKHIYILNNQRVRRLEYSNPAAEWKEMSSMIKYHGMDPPAAALNGSIFVCGAGSITESRAVERYNAALDRWDDMCDMNMGRTSPCVVATEDHIYCMGGNDGGAECRSVERFDERLNEWEFVQSLPRSISSTNGAAFENCIYVADLANDDAVLCYDIQNNLWSDIILSCGYYWYTKILAANEELYIIVGDISKLKRDKSAYAIYSLEPRTEHMTLVEEWESKEIEVCYSFAGKL